MKLTWLDISIVILYLVSMVTIGWVLRKKARQNKESYLMGSKSLPWYLLGLSDASDMFDISGTMWMVALCFIYGMKSIWIPWLWPVFNQVFLMMYLSKWLRRSNATTGAEWLGTRFGSNERSAAVTASHISVVVFALLGCFGFLAYGFVGLGKFMEIFIPWSSVQPHFPFHVAPEYVPHIYGIVFTLFATFYSVIGGMHSIVIGDLIKYIILTVACVAVGILAFIKLHGHPLQVPAGWHNPFFGKQLGLDWSMIIKDANKKIAEDGFSPFGFFFMMMLFKGVFASLAGPAPNYDMQKILSTRSPKEASKMTGFVSIVLLPIRYALIIGLTVLALLNYNQLDLSSPTGTDFEKILPAAIIRFIPAGIMGLLFTGLLGAFMSTFSGTLNAAQAYVVNDIYLKYINPKATNEQIIRRNYAVGIAVVLLSILLGFFVKNVNSVLQWIVGALYGGYIAANMFKWYWWRFNANGFFWGMATGITAALIFPYLFEGQLPLYNWPLLFLISVIGCIAGTYSAAPTDIETLKKFYITVRPWGFWKPIQRLVQQENPEFEPNRRFGLDMFNVAIGIVAQCCLTILPMFLVLWMKLPFLITAALLAIIIIILKKTWWSRLEN
jgi:SSS family solute:Na+ symporter